MYKDFISQGIKILENDSKLSLCAFSFQYVTDEIKSKANFGYGEGIVPADIYLKKLYIHAGACIFRKVYSIQQCNYMKNIGYFDDNNIVIANLNFGSMYYIDRVVYCYRQTGLSIWTSINLLEQNVINAIDYNVNLLYCSKYPNEIKQRHLSSLYFVFKNRKRIYHSLGKDKADKYVDMAKDIPDSLVYKIMIFNQLTKQEKITIKRFVTIPLLKRIRSYCGNIYSNLFYKDR